MNKPDIYYSQIHDAPPFPEKQELCVHAFKETYHVQKSCFTQMVLAGFAWSLFWLPGWGQTTWTQRNPLPNVNCIAWAGTQFVAVGDSGYILTFSDGKTYEQKASGTLSNLRWITWSGGLVVAVGDNGAICTSSNGDIWTSESSGVSYQLNSVLWANNRFFAVGNSGTLLTSSDGKTWIKISLGLMPSQDLSCIVWADTQYIAVGGTPNSYNSALIYTSSDGTTWTNRDISQLIVPMCYSVASISGHSIASAKGKILTSPDGIKWTSATPNMGVERIVAADNKFLSFYSGSIFTSTDGITWIKKCDGPISDIRTVDWCNGLYAVSGFGGSIFTSAVGNTWKSIAGVDAGVPGWLNSVKWTGSQFVVLGSDYPGDSSVILTSPDGLLWTRRRVSESHHDLMTFAWSDKMLVAVGRSVLSSPDGFTWTKRSSRGTRVLRAINWTGSQFVAVGDYATISTSPDGIAWKDTILPMHFDGLEDLNNVVWTGTFLIAVGTLGTIFTSPDGVAWTRRTGSSNLNCLVWNGSMLVAMGYPGTILTSPDGVTWTSRASPVTGFFWGLTWTGSLFAAVSDNGTILTSPDGVTWNMNTTGATVLADLIWTGRQFVATGTKATIFTSNDGASWNSQNLSSRSIASLAGLAHNDSMFVAVGNYGTIFTSRGKFANSIKQPAALTPGRRFVSSVRVTISGNTLAVHLAGFPQGKNMVCRIIDVSGKSKTVIRGSTAQASTEFSIPARGLASGVYYLEARSENVAAGCLFMNHK